ncbi:hypothetical protein NUW58_g3888 [Xylaria curta]|uniref:Uncharacterized protein n=1 Tax=Xylaria curta TaxID=42375 RepID=A0ACC1P8Y3_9PEZI|nr:hypothetical protein NUW58_g3888 [Xylaria curta]
MGNISSTPGALATHTPTPGTHALSETRPSFSIPPFEPSTFVTKTASHSSRGGLSPTRTGEYCSWDWERDTTSCSSWVYTVDVPTPFTLPTPPGGYGTSESSLGFPYYTCTDFLCIDSVVSKYGFSLCFPTATPPFGLPTETETWRSTEDSTPYAVPTTTSACDPVFDWENCPGPTSEPLYSIPDTWTWPTDEPPETSSDCDSSVAPAPTEDCDFGVECYTSVRFTIPG